MASKIKGSLLFLWFALFALPVHAQVSSLTATTPVGGNFTLSWGNFGTTYTLKENNATIYTGSSRTRTYNRQPGTYQYRVSNCANGGQGCVYSNTVTVTVANTGPPPLQFSAATVQQFLASARGQDKELANLVGDEIEARLRAANLTLNEEGLIYRETLPNQQLRGGCTANVQLRNLHVSAGITSDSSFDVIMNSLSKPIVASVQIIGFVDVDGTLRMRLGVKILGECIRYLRTSVDASVKTDFTINTSLMIKLNPTRVADAPSGTMKIKINPELKLAGRARVTSDIDLTNGQLSVLGIDATGILGNILAYVLYEVVEDYVQGGLNSAASAANNAFGPYLAAQEAVLLRKLREDIPQEYVIPVSSADQNEMLSFISHYATSFLPPGSYLQANATELLYYLLVGDDKALRDRIATSVACNASASLFSLNMARTTQPADFRSTTLAEFCSKVENRFWLGNAEPAVSGYNGQDPWTLAPATTFNISTVAPIQSNYQPYMKRVQYRAIDNIIDGTRRVVSPNYAVALNACYQAGQGYCSNPPNIDNYSTFEPIPRGSGSCKLEMRIYKKEVAQNTGLKPLLAIHGGSWKYRGAAFYGLESQISNFTERGFVVFVPFYRLRGEADGNTECQKATAAEIVSDANEALNWVQANKGTYGVAAGERVRLYGQSAGAHLAGWLVTHRGADVQKALLMYPPTDAQDYILKFQAFARGQTYSPDYAGSFTGLGVESLEGYLSLVAGGAVQLQEVDPYSPLVLDNSFPGQVAASPSSFPPVYMVHGKVDRLVPSIQSVRLCNAYSGNPAAGPASNSGSGARQSYVCGTSRVDLLEEANHALELCLPPLRCEAGTSQAALDDAKQSLIDARLWLTQ